MNKSTCPICDGIKKESNKFCSYSCRNKARIWSSDSREKMSNTIKNINNSCYLDVILHCNKCDKPTKIKIHKNAKQKEFYCSTKCARSRDFSISTKEKISNSLKEFFDKKGRLIDLIRECVYCNKSFQSKKRSQKFCSRKCAAIQNMASDEARENARIRMLNTLSKLIEKKRSKNEELFFSLCLEEFKNVNHNEAIFNGWDADILIIDYKIAILWNGKWHYEKLTKKHSVEQVKTRDKIKLKHIVNSGWIPYIVKDMGRFNKKFVEDEFKKFKEWMITQTTINA